MFVQLEPMFFPWQWLWMEKCQFSVAPCWVSKRVGTCNRFTDVFQGGLPRSLNTSQSAASCDCSASHCGAIDCASHCCWNVQYQGSKLTVQVDCFRLKLSSHGDAWTCQSFISFLVDLLVSKSSSSGSMFMQFCNSFFSRHSEIDTRWKNQCFLNSRL